MSRRSPSLLGLTFRSAAVVALFSIWLLGAAESDALTIAVEADGGSSLALDESDLGCETSGVLMLCGDQADPETISGSWSNSDFDLMVSGVFADTDPIITIGFGFTNTSGITQTYTVATTLPIPPLASPVQIAGSAGFTITDGSSPLDSVTLANDSGTPIFAGLIDNSVVGSAGDPFSLSCTSVGILPCTTTDSVSIPIDTLAQGVASSIGMVFRFTLTPGDSLGVSGSFVVEPVPEPGVGLLLGMAIATLGWASRKGRHTARR